MSSSLCAFNGCAVAAMPRSSKCSFHRNRQQCMVDACSNQVYARRLCVRHGGKRACSFEGCVSNARNGTRCCKHGASSSKHTCRIDGCDKIAHARRLCVSHGGGRLCSIDGCHTHARRRGLCMRHSTPDLSALAPPKDAVTMFVVKATDIDVAGPDAFTGFDMDLTLLDLPSLNMLDGFVIDFDACLMVGAWEA